MALDGSNFSLHMTGLSTPDVSVVTSGDATSRPCLTALEPAALNTLELQARGLAENLDQLLGSVHSALHRMSGLTVDCVSVFANSVELTCDSVDASIKNTYALMAKCEELSKSMAQLIPLEKEISTVKCTLDRFEDVIKNASNY
ncbi:hypothetical protein CRM22_000107 [Opisthorchis felineus]|uniref:BLOC-1-related complex subunit 6 C-terminal helix domain-containing protein n=1 Tax=Opisthorchis felineus TaxID=147828 RepID=A0A4S2MGJ3_OPIFE|nr:hypothetical protein CRM22_000107 [Opisthorchis felineus]TGZ75941.1 hypothetical protein CRM22_000107 [Opisthorchis felineus]